MTAAAYGRLFVSLLDYGALLMIREARQRRDERHYADDEGW